jgi:hypothetical protein
MEMKMGRPRQVKANVSDRRSRLVSLVYEVLRDMKTPDEAMDEEMLLFLSRAFLDKATAKREADAPKERGDKPTFMYSTAAGHRNVSPARRS